MEWKNAFDELPPAGVPVIAFVPSYGGGDKSRCIRAQYAPAKTLCAAGWYETNEYEDVHWSVGDRVTHWMPLPPPPNIQGKGRE